jgi:hypothetical protein
MVELGGPESTGEKIRSAIEKTGVVFIEENGGGLGVRLRSRFFFRHPLACRVA